MELLSSESSSMMTFSDHTCRVTTLASPAPASRAVSGPAVFHMPVEGEASHPPAPWHVGEFVPFLKAFQVTSSLHLRMGSEIHPAHLDAHKAGILRQFLGRRRWRFFGRRLEQHALPPATTPCASRALPATSAAARTCRTYRRGRPPSRPALG